jgi:hypothetical protein
MNGYSHTHCPSILICACAGDYTTNPVVVLEGLFKWLQDQAADSLATRKAGIGAVVEGEGLSMVIKDAKIEALSIYAIDCVA